MWRSGKRLVRTVRLSAPEAALIRRGAILLEDALRTASLPASGRGRLLVVRSLRVGRIDPRESPAHLALAIEARLSRIDTAAVYAEDPAAAAAEAVYFHDAIEPSLRLALRIARREGADAWFWPLAVRGWTPAMPRDEALRALLFAAAGGEGGAAAIVSLFRALQEQKALTPLLEALRPQEASRLLQIFGWSLPTRPLKVQEPVSAVEEAEVIGPFWRSLLFDWVRRWGEEDDRSVIMASIALAAEQPARLLDLRLPERALGLIREMIWKRGAPSFPSLGKDRPSPPWPGASPTDTRQGAGDIGTASDRQVDRHGILSGEPSESSSEETEFRGHNPEAQPRRDWEEEAFQTIPEAIRSEEQDAWAGAEPVNRAWGRSAGPTRYGGLFFLLPLIDRFGVSAFLEAHPHLIDQDLPRLTLRSVARALAIPDDDPVLRLLEEMPVAADAPWHGFVQPDLLREGLSVPSPSVIRRAIGRPGFRLLFDSSGRLPLALCRRAIPRSFFEGRPLRRGEAVRCTSEGEIAAAGWHTALRRWVRRYAGMGLHALVRRPGWIASTPTHIDLFFDHRQVDLRVRRAGLDLDPGWLPWLGRVVQFHYLDGESLHGG